MSYYSYNKIVQLILRFVHFLFVSEIGLSDFSAIAETFIVATTTSSSAMNTIK